MIGEKHAENVALRAEVPPMIAEKHAENEALLKEVDEEGRERAAAWKETLNTVRRNKS